MKRRSSDQDIDALRLGIVVTTMTLLEFTVVVYITSVVVGWSLG